MMEMRAAVGMYNYNVGCYVFIRVYQRSTFDVGFISTRVYIWQ